MLNKIHEQKMFSVGLEILHEIENRGFQALFVGGCVRDLILDIPCKDVDIATNAPLEVLDSMFPSHDIGKNKDFGILVVNRKGFDFEVACFRTDGSYEDGRHPDSVCFVESFEDDAKRRDLTINSLGLDKEGNFHDHVSGMEDIKNKIIRAVGDAQKRFSEDGLRIMRCVRFASRFNFKMCEETKKAIKVNLHMLDNVSPERIKDELWKMANQKGEIFAHSLEMMKELGILDKILPEVTLLEKFEHCEEHHPEGIIVFDHVIAAIRQNKIADSLINISLLCHDLGKGHTYELKDGWKHTFYRHEFVSGKIIEHIAKRLKFSNDEKDAIKFAAVNHMKFHNMLQMKPSKIVELMKSPHFEILKQVSFCDDSCRLHVFDEQKWNQVINKITEIETSFGAAMKKTKMVDGNHVMELLNIKPGKILGDVIKATTAWMFDSGVSDPILVDAKIVEFFNEMKD